VKGASPIAWRVLLKPSDRLVPRRTLLVRKVSGGGVDRRCRTESAGWENIVAIDLQCARKNWVEAIDEWAAAEGRYDDATRTRARAARCYRGSALSGANLRSSPPTPSRVCSARRRYLRRELPPSFGAPDVGVGNVQVIARNGDVEIVFERQRHCIIHRNVELAVVHELVDARVLARFGGSTCRGVYGPIGSGKCESGFAYSFTSKGCDDDGMPSAPTARSARTKHPAPTRQDHRGGKKKGGNPLKRSQHCRTLHSHHLHRSKL